MRWFRIILFLLALVLAGCGGVPSNPSPPTAETAAVATPSEAPTTPEPAGTTGSEEPTETIGTAVPIEPAVTVAPAETVATASAGPRPAAIWVQNGTRLVPVVIDRPRVIDLAEGDAQVNPGVVVIAPDGSRFAYGVNTPDRLGVAIVDLNSGQTTFIAGASFGARFSPEGRSLVYTVADEAGSRLVVRDLQTGEERSVLQGTARDVPQAIAWLPSGIAVQWLIVPSDAPPQRLELLDPASGAVGSIRGQSYLHAELTSDGSKVAIVTGFWAMGASGEAGLAVLDTATGAEQVIVPQTRGQIPAVRWSPDGALLAYSSMTEFEEPVRTLHVVPASGSGGVTMALGDLGTLHDVAWRDPATLLLLITDAGGTLRLYELPATAADASAAREVGAYDALQQGSIARILVARQ